jgi:hypothetical protein
MGNILLLGAGFSFNWGAPLASGVRSFIAMRLERHQYLSDLLNRYDSFEEALHQVQREFSASSGAHEAAERLRILQEAIIATFDDMNKAMATGNFEFYNDIQYSIGSYLTEFDAIFTLNQDLLLERHYLHPHAMILSRSNAKKPGGEIPGMQPIMSHQYYGEDQPLHTRWQQKPQPFDLSRDFQPYFKLHGSTNWFSPNNEMLIVMGGDKTATIVRHPILLWYAEKFREYLSRPGACLTVIGFGFADHHINKLLSEAWNESKFPMLIVNPEGRGILKKINPSYGGAIYARGPLEDIKTYDSTLPLSITFGGSHQMEHRKLLDFLKPPT